MVFIELKSSYIEAFKSSPEMINVIDFILNQTNAATSNHGQKSIDRPVNSLIHAILDRNNILFCQIEEYYKRRKPDSSSPWINNNYLIFLLLIGQSIFETDNSWLKAVIGIRKKNDEETGIILDFFNSILSRSAASATGTISPLHLVYIFHTDPIKITNSMVNESLIALNKVQDFPHFHNEFLNILYLGAFQIALLSKDIVNYNLKDKVEKLKLKCNKGISTISNVILFFLLIVTLLIIFLFVKNIFLTLSERWRNGIVTIIGIGGLTILEIVRGRRKIKNWVENRLRRILGINLLN